MKIEVAEIMERTYELSVPDKCDVVALLCAQIPMDVIDLKDVIDIIKENRDRYMEGKK